MADEECLLRKKLLDLILINSINAATAAATSHHRRTIGCKRYAFKKLIANNFRQKSYSSNSLTSREYYRYRCLSKAFLRLFTMHCNSITCRSYNSMTATSKRYRIRTYIECHQYVVVKKVFVALQMKLLSIKKKRLHNRLIIRKSSYYRKIAYHHFHRWMLGYKRNFDACNLVLFNVLINVLRNALIKFKSYCNRMQYKRLCKYRSTYRYESKVIVMLVKRWRFYSIRSGSLRLLFKVFRRNYPVPHCSCARKILRSWKKYIKQRIKYGKLFRQVIAVKEAHAKGSVFFNWYKIHLHRDYTRKRLIIQLRKNVELHHCSWHRYKIHLFRDGMYGNKYWKLIASATSKLVYTRMCSMKRMFNTFKLRVRLHRKGRERVATRQAEGRQILSVVSKGYKKSLLHIYYSKWKQEMKSVILRMNRLVLCTYVRSRFRHWNRLYGINALNRFNRSKEAMINAAGKFNVNRIKLKPTDAVRMTNSILHSLHNSSRNTSRSSSDVKSGSTYLCGNTITDECALIAPSYASIHISRLKKKKV